uniref:Uncharacterized protein n=1 Tax=Spironucleus salmonicida TaxID=348837 RepID=V6LQM2_9EUKA|eukprot:EST46880.1 Hypothetical protein SS50377_13032 [Spironucleus salmonicida]
MSYIVLLLPSNDQPSTSGHCVIHSFELYRSGTVPITWQGLQGVSFYFHIPRSALRVLLQSVQISQVPVHQEDRAQSTGIQPVIGSPLAS